MSRRVMAVTLATGLLVGAVVMATVVPAIAGARSARTLGALAVGPGAADPYEPDETTTQATLVTPTSGGTAQTRTFVPAGDVDWIRVPAKAGRAYTITAQPTGSLAEPTLELFAPDASTSIAYDAGGYVQAWMSGQYWRAPTIAWPESADTTYYARIANRSRGGTAQDGYQLVVRDWGAVDAAEPDSKPSQARPIALETTVTRTFNPPGDPDFVEVTVTAGLKYAAVASSATRTVQPAVEVFDERGTTLISPPDWGLGWYPGWPFLGYFPFGASAQAYFLAPRSGRVLVRTSEMFGRGGESASYSLRVSYLGATDPYEPDESTAVATALLPGAHGQVHELFPANDVDYFAIKGFGPNHYVRIRTYGLSKGLTTNLMVFDRRGFIIGNDWRSRPGGSVVEVVTADTRTYYAAVSSYSTFDPARRGYRIRMSVFRRGHARISGVHVPANGSLQGVFVVTGKTTPGAAVRLFVTKPGTRRTAYHSTTAGRAGRFRFEWSPWLEKVWVLLPRGRSHLGKAWAQGRIRLRILVNGTPRYWGVASKKYSTYIW